MSRTRAMHLAANLPPNIFPESCCAAGYLLNRSPNKRLRWMSPLAFLQKWVGIKSYLPQVAHLRVFGCRAYPLIKNRSKLNKLGPRAHIGYLVGYKSTNIFRIWILSLRRVISIRDVTFNEDTFYDPTLNGKLTELEVIQI